MQTIPIKPGQVFLLELDSGISENEKAAVLAEWNKIFPDNPLVIVTKGSLSILATK